MARTAEFVAGARTIIPAPGTAGSGSDDGQNTTSDLFEAMIHSQDH
jgi:hypothetical protein